jgi:hypothetical protein
MIDWVVTLGLVIAAVFFIQVPLKRALQGKAMSMADYAFYTVWNQPVDQYKDKGEANTYSESEENATQRTVLREIGEQDLNTTFNTTNTQLSNSWTVEEGSEVRLRKNRPLLRSIISKWLGFC